MTEIEFQPLKELDAIKDYVQNRWTLGRIHGISHWKRVEQNGLLLSVEKQEDGKLYLRENVNLKVVRYFAYLHDSCRLNDWADLEHGERAAQMILELRDTHLTTLTDHEITLLEKACRLHTVEHRTGNPTVDVCFDADRLDLGRVGITPEPSKMATAQGATLAAHPHRLEQLSAEISQIDINLIAGNR